MVLGGRNRLTTNELREAKLRLEMTVEKLNTEIASLETEIEAAFRESRTVEGKKEQEDLARRLRELTMKRDHKLASHKEKKREIELVATILSGRERQHRHP